MTATLERPSSGAGPTRDDPAYRRRWWILAVLCLSLLVVSLDNTILNVALPSLGRDLDASSSQLQWFIDAYTLVFASLLLTAGSLGDKFGRRLALVVGLGIFGAGSLASAWAGSAAHLIGTRALMGVGGAFIMPATLSILTNIFPPKERATAIGIWAGVSGLGVAIGPITGGLLLEHYWWGSVFLVNVPVVIVAVIAAFWIIPESKDRHAPRLDPIGTVLSILALTALLYGLIEAPSHGWTSAIILWAFGIGAVLLVAFVLWELHCDHPMLDMRFFANRRFSAASIAVTFVFFALYGSLYFLTLYLQDVLDYSPLEAGASVAPIAGILMIAAPLSSVVVRWIGTKIVVGAGLLIVAAGLFLLAAISTSSGYPLVLGVLILLGFGMGTAMAPATDSIMGSLPPERAGVGSAVNDTTRELGGALGVAVLGSILASHYRVSITSVAGFELLPPAAADAVKDGISGATAVAARLPAEAARQLNQAADAAFVNAISATVIVGAVIAVVGALIAFVFLPARAERVDDEEQAQVLDPLVYATAQRLSAPKRSAVMAALGILAEGGFASLSYSGLATKSGVPAASLRRMWRDKVDLVRDAITLLRTEHPLPETGDIRADCRAYLQQLIEVLEDPVFGPIVIDLLGEATRDPHLAAALQSEVRERRTELVRMLDAAVRRGDLDADRDTTVLADVLIGSVYFEHIATGERARPRAAAEIVNAVLGNRPVPAG